MIKIFPKIVTLALCALTLSGCLTGCASDRASNLPGIWEVRAGSASVEAPKALENVDTPGGLASAMATLGNTQLTLDKDGTFLMAGALNAQGNWAFDNKTSELTLKSQSAATPLNIKAKISDSGQVISLPNPTGAGEPVELQKKEG